MADEKITEVPKVYQEYLTDMLTYLTYIIKKGEMEEAEETYQDNLRKLQKGK